MGHCKQRCVKWLISSLNTILCGLIRDYGYGIVGGQLRLAFTGVGSMSTPGVLSKVAEQLSGDILNRSGGVTEISPSRRDSSRLRFFEAKSSIIV